MKVVLYVFLSYYFGYNRGYVPESSQPGANECLLEIRPHTKDIVAIIGLPMY